MPKPKHRTSKNRKRPPWGDILGGAPVPLFNEVADRWYSPAVETRRRMELLRERYGARDWYELAVALAAQQDIALTIERPPGRRWDGGIGAELVTIVEPLLAAGWTWQAIADELRDEHRDEFYQTMTSDALRARYHDARRYLKRRTTCERD
jgi:hypothetical protein